MAYPVKHIIFMQIDNSLQNLKTNIPAINLSSDKFFYVQDLSDFHVEIHYHVDVVVKWLVSFFICFLVNDLMTACNIFVIA